MVTRDRQAEFDAATPADGSMSSGEKRILIVTGAGASRRLGAGGPMPLMSDWSDALVDAMNDEEPTLAENVLRLSKGLAGDEFEETLGAFLRWSQTLDETERFVQLGRVDPSGVSSDLMTWIAHARNRLPRMIKAINRSLWSEFGLNRVDIDIAANAYRELCRALGALPEQRDTKLFSVTTNYDRSGEAAWELVGFKCDDGGRRRRPGGSMLLEVDQVRPWGTANTVPHLHLHGAVGWYRDGAGIRIEAADRPFDERQTPVVLYPDPVKDPTNDADVQALWKILDEAIAEATHVLVLGHSLHDRPLLNRLATAAGRVRFAIGFYSDPDDLSARLPLPLQRHDIDLSLVRVDFHPEGDFSGLTGWIRGGTVNKDQTVIGGHT